MKINLDKLREVENSYEGHDITRETLSSMLKTVLDFYNSSYSIAPDNVKLAYNTLIDLRIIEEDLNKEKEIQHLYS